MVFALLQSVVTMFSPESVAALFLIESTAWRSLRGISGGPRVPGGEDLGRYGLFWGEVTFIKPETQANGETETAPRHPVRSAVKAEPGKTILPEAQPHLLRLEDAVAEVMAPEITASLWHNSGKQPNLQPCVQKA